VIQLYRRRTSKAWLFATSRLSSSHRKSYS
jgi:hypothetical protein